MCVKSRLTSETKQWWAGKAAQMHACWTDIAYGSLWELLGSWMHYSNNLHSHVFAFWLTTPRGGRTCHSFSAWFSASLPAYVQIGSLWVARGAAARYWLAGEEAYQDFDQPLWSTYPICREEHWGPQDADGLPSSSRVQLSTAYPPLMMSLTICFVQSTSLALMWLLYVSKPYWSTRTSLEFSGVLLVTTSLGFFP